ncbi:MULTISPECIES: hypothetical protein [Shouchella]|uniref:Uncharacterized protein n=2 Tax=Bacillaceae TaxID=186817 RepID=A0A060LQW8_9BACI|nr:MULTISPECIES: hypothetical protein [Bacillaceae]AIC93666.1 hypothetical protein BleG1_1063 [Shouchella lehensis G1]KQL56449.1 hypothetical protein AN965_14120 [Alkalicoccobacillus plakortidis]RQW21899.1 hypothetical protein EH196_05135 [Bacillus sp. C1-1]
MLSIQQNGNNTTDVYKGLTIVARFIRQDNGQVAVKVLTDGHDEMTDNEQKALLIVKERI